MTWRIRKYTRATPTGATTYTHHLEAEAVSAFAQTCGGVLMDGSEAFALFDGPRRHATVDAAHGVRTEDNPLDLLCSSRLLLNLEEQCPEKHQHRRLKDRLSQKLRTSVRLIGSSTYYPGEQLP